MLHVDNISVVYESLVDPVRKLGGSRSLVNLCTYAYVGTNCSVLIIKRYSTFQISGCAKGEETRKQARE